MPATTTYEQLKQHFLQPPKTHYPWIVASWDGTDTAGLAALARLTERLHFGGMLISLPSDLLSARGMDGVKQMAARLRPTFSDEHPVWLRLNVFDLMGLLSGEGMSRATGKPSTSVSVRARCLRVSTELWRRLRFRPLPEFAFAVPELNDPTVHLADVRQDLGSEQLPDALSMSSQCHLILYWGVRSFETDVPSLELTDRTLTNLKSFLRLLREESQGAVRGVLLGWDGQENEGRFRWWSPAFMEAIRSVQSNLRVSCEQILRAISFDPSESAASVRQQFWEALAVAMEVYLIRPLQESCREVGMEWGWDLSTFQNLTSLVIALGSLTPYLQPVNVARRSTTESKTEPQATEVLVSAQGLVAKLVSSMNESQTKPRARALLNESASVQDELREALSAARHGAQGFCRTIRRPPDLPEWVARFVDNMNMVGSVMADDRLAQSLIGAEIELNCYIANLSVLISQTDSGADLAVLFPSHSLERSVQLCPWRRVSELVEEALLDTTALLERYHFTWEFVDSKSLLAPKSAPCAQQCQVSSLEREPSLERESKDECRNGNPPQPLRHPSFAIRHSFDVLIAPHARGEPSALWDCLSLFVEEGGSILFLCPPPASTELTRATPLSSWLRQVAVSYEGVVAIATATATATHARSAALEVHPVIYQSPSGGYAGLFDWRTYPDPLESPLMAHRMLTTSRKPIVETHHHSIATQVRLVEETPVILVYNLAEAEAEFNLRVRCLGMVEVWEVAAREVAPQLHCARVEFELDEEEPPALVIPRRLPGRGVVALSIPPGAQLHVESASFNVTRVQREEDGIVIEGLSSGGVPSASLRVGHRVVESEGDPLLSLSPYSLESPQTESVQLIVIAEVGAWEVSLLPSLWSRIQKGQKLFLKRYGFPKLDGAPRRDAWIPRRRVSWQLVEAGSSFPPLLSKPNRKACFQTLLTTAFPPQRVWLCVESGSQSNPPLCKGEDEGVGGSLDAFINLERLNSDEWREIGTGRRTAEVTHLLRQGQNAITFIAHSASQEAPRCWLVVFFSERVTSDWQDLQARAQQFVQLTPSRPTQPTRTWIKGSLVHNYRFVTPTHLYSLGHSLALELTVKADIIPFRITTEASQNSTLRQTQGETRNLKPETRLFFHSPTVLSLPAAPYALDITVEQLLPRWESKPDLRKRPSTQVAPKHAVRMHIKLKLY